MPANFPLRQIIRRPEPLRGLSHCRQIIRFARVGIWPADVNGGWRRRGRPLCQGCQSRANQQNGPAAQSGIIGFAGHVMAADITGGKAAGGGNGGGGLFPLNHHHRFFPIIIPPKQYRIAVAAVSGGVLPDMLAGLAIFAGLAFATGIIAVRPSARFAINLDGGPAAIIPGAG